MRQGVLNSYRASVVFWLMVLLVVGVFATDYLISPRPATAADEAAPAEPAAPAAPAVEPAAEDTAAADEEAAMQESYLVWFYKALGLKYVVVFLAISFTLVAFFVMNLLVTRRDQICPLHLVEGFEGHLNEKQYQEAYELAKADESILGQVLASGLAKLSTAWSNPFSILTEMTCTPAPTRGRPRLRLARASCFCCVGVGSWKVSPANSLSNSAVASSNSAVFISQ